MLPIVSLIYGLLHAGCYSYCAVRQ